MQLYRNSAQRGVGRHRTGFSKTSPCLALQRCLTAPLGCLSFGGQKENPVVVNTSLTTSMALLSRAPSPSLFSICEIKPDTTKDGWYFPCLIYFCARFLVTQNKHRFKYKSKAALWRGEDAQTFHLYVFSLLVYINIWKSCTLRLTKQIAFWIHGPVGFSYSLGGFVSLSYVVLPSTEDAPKAGEAHVFPALLCRALRPSLRCCCKTRFYSTMRWGAEMLLACVLTAVSSSGDSAFCFCGLRCPKAPPWRCR